MFQKHALILMVYDYQLNLCFFHASKEDEPKHITSLKDLFINVIIYTYLYNLFLGICSSVDEQAQVL